MEVYTAQPEEAPEEGEPEASSAAQGIPASPLKKFLPIIVGIVVFVLLLSGVIVLLVAGRGGGNKAAPTPVPRPTATPYVGPTDAVPISSVTPFTASPTPSSVSSLVTILQFAYIREGRVYEGTPSSQTLLANSTQGGKGTLAWSPRGNNLSWRELDSQGFSHSLSVFSKQTNTILTISGSSPSARLVDYAWAPDESEIALLYQGDEFSVWVVPYGASVSKGEGKLLFSQSAPIVRVLWPQQSSLLVSGKDSILAVDSGTKSVRTVIANTVLLDMKLSPHRDKLLYLVENGSVLTVYVAQPDGTQAQMVSSIPASSDMGATGFPETIFSNGFTSSVAWFSDGNKLLIGYRFQTGLPLVGIYNLSEKSFRALAVFPLASEDAMINDTHVVGVRKGIGSFGESQVVMYEIENNSRFNITRVIPKASFPALYIP